MSTRAIYSFIDEDNPDGIFVYKHHDGYPTGGLYAILSTLPYVWPLPRFEADEFAAGFVAANKHPWSSDLMRHARSALMAKSTGDEYEELTSDITISSSPWKMDNSGGGVRLLPFGNGLQWTDVAPGDIQYMYEVRMHTSEDQKVQGLHVTIYKVRLDDNDEWSRRSIWNELADQYKELHPQELDRMIESSL